MKLICYYLSMDYIKNMGLWDFIASERDIKNNICLYAYTTKKKIAKEFEKYRDMNKFIKRVHDVTKEEFDEFESSNIYHRIDIYELLTRSDNEDELVCSIRLPVVEIENSYCEDTYEFIDDSFVDCYTVIKKVNSIDKPYISTHTGKDICLLKEGYYMVEYLPKSGNYEVRVFLNEKKEAVSYYIDVIDDIDIEYGKGLYYDDLYLDITIDKINGDVVKVYTIGDFSKEICGGPHVKHTGELGHFKIKKEESSSAGIRRIKAVLE